MQQPPAFQFYASDYLSSSKVQRMTLEAEGAYIRLLAYSWQDGWIPADVRQLARLCKCTAKKMAALWEGFLRECFEPLESDPTHLINRRLEQVRTMLLEHKAERSEAGSRGAAKRWGTYGSANGSAIKEPLAKNSSPSPSPSPSSSSKESISQEYVSRELRAKRALTKPPDIFELTVNMRAWAATEGFTVAEIDRETPAMLDHFRGSGTSKADWEATWRNWMRNSRKFGGTNGNGTKSKDDLNREAGERALAKVNSQNRG